MTNEKYNLFDQIINGLVYEFSINFSKENGTHSTITIDFSNYDRDDYSAKCLYSILDAIKPIITREIYIACDIFTYCKLRLQKIVRRKSLSIFNKKATVLIDAHSFFRWYLERIDYQDDNYPLEELVREIYQEYYERKKI